MIDRVKNWDKLPLCYILYDLQLIYNIFSKMNIEPHNCESGVWITIKLELKSKEYIIQGSRLGIVRDRLVTFLDKHGVRYVVIS